jgi:nucleoside-diphosphate-sugar epimerase
MRVAVTGASGFVGGWIVRELVRRGHTVHAFGRRSASQLSRGIPNYRQWDLADGLVPVPAVDAVVHCAAHVGHWGDEAAYERVNVQGTRHVLAAFEGVEPFIYVSTSSVYAPGRAGRAIAEDAPIGGAGLTAYARTKAAAEGIVATSNRRAVVLRPHIVYGPGDTTLLPRLLKARRNGYLAVPGTGRNRVSVTHVLNLALAVERALVVAGARGIYNVADAEAPSVAALLHATFEQLALPTRLVFVPRRLAWEGARLIEAVHRRSGAVREPLLTRYVVASLADEHVLDIGRARVALGYDPRFTLREAFTGDAGLA